MVPGSSGPWKAGGAEMPGGQVWQGRDGEWWGSWPSIIPGSLGVPSSPQLCRKHCWLPRVQMLWQLPSSFGLPRASPGWGGVPACFSWLKLCLLQQPPALASLPAPQSPNSQFLQDKHPLSSPRELSSGPRLPAVLREGHRLSHLQNQA